MNPTEDPAAQPPQDAVDATVNETSSENTVPEPEIVSPDTTAESSPEVSAEPVQEPEKAATTESAPADAPAAADEAAEAISPADSTPPSADEVPPEPTNAAPAVAPETTTPANSEATVVVSSDEPAAPTASAAAPAVVAGRSNRHRNKLLALIVVVVVILLAGGYTFAFYLPNTPNRVYSSGLTNTGKALDKLITYTQTEDTANYKSASIDGTMKYKSSSVSFDSTLNGSFDKDSNGKMEFKADIEGENVAANFISKKAAGNTSPDLYVQVSGVKSYLDSTGLGALDSLDGQWISIDHTLLDTLVKAQDQNAAQTDEVYLNFLDNKTLPTTAQINDAITKVQTVNRQYIFTTDSSKAVLTNQKFIAKGTQNGRSADHYTVGYDKTHLQAYVTALKGALDSSKLNDWSKKANGGQSLSDTLDFTSLEDSVKNAKTGYTFDLWVDTKTKLVNSVQFTDSSDNSKFTIGQNYTGGTTYPLLLSVSGSSDSNGSFGLSVDTKTHKYTLNFAVMPGTGSADDGTVTGNITVTPGNSDVKVSAPSGATSINDVLNQLGLGGLLDSMTTDQTDSASLDSGFSLTQ